VALGIVLTPAQVSLGLAAPSAAAALMGDVGAILILTMLFMAVTSAGSAELVAVSSLVTYDVYRTYRNPSATGKQLLKVSKYTIIFFGIGMGGLATVLLQAGLSLGYVYLAMGVIIGSAVIPIALTLLWKKTTKAAATGGAIAGLVGGLAAWFITAQMMYGEISLASTGANIPLLAGNVVAIILGGAIAFLGSLVRPANFDFKAMREDITLVDEKGVHYEDSREKDEMALKKAFKFSVISGLVMTLVLVVAWPIPLHASGYVFDSGFYGFWVTIALVWASGAAAVIIGLPIVEARGGIAHVLKGMAGGSRRVPESEPTRPE
jgi:Na+/proline symporter